VLSNATQAVLRARARAASEATGGVVEPWDVLVGGGLDGGDRVAKDRPRERGRDSAEVELTYDRYLKAGRRRRRAEEGDGPGGAGGRTWRVDLPLDDTR